MGAPAAFPGYREGEDAEQCPATTVRTRQVEEYHEAGEPAEAVGAPELGSDRGGEGDEAATEKPVNDAERYLWARTEQCA